MHINCGGNKNVTIGNTTYEGDEYSAGAAKFFTGKRAGEPAILETSGVVR